MARAGLNREAVTAIALRLVDDGGLTGFATLSLAKVAAEAGVATPSLYKHVGSLADLRRAVAVVAATELTRTVAAATIGRSGPDALRALAHAVRDFARDHPGRYAATQVAPDPDDPADAPLSAAGAEAIAVIGAALRGFDVPADRTIDVIRAVRAAIHGFVGLEVGGGYRLPEDLDQSFDLLVDLLIDGIDRVGSTSSTGSAHSRPQDPRGRPPGPTPTEDHP